MVETVEFAAVACSTPGEPTVAVRTRNEARNQVYLRHICPSPRGMPAIIDEAAAVAVALAERFAGRGNLPASDLTA